jgi:DNA-binding NarL/FixJ family response regulator
MLSLAIIEDNTDFAFVLANYLDAVNDFHVAAVYHFANEALKGLKQKPVDIAIVDVELHGASGIELIRKMAMAGSSTKYMMLTMHTDDQTVFDALNAGANGYLLKDSSPKKIIEAICELAKGEAPMSSLIAGKLLKYFSNKSKKEITDNSMLSFREKEIMRQLSRGLLYKEIAVLLGIQKDTVKKHLSKIYAKLNVQNKIEAINKFFAY